MSPTIEASVQNWAIAANALSLLGILVGVLVGRFRGLMPGLVAGLLAFAVPWAVAAARTAWLGAGFVAYALGGFALVPSAMAAVVATSHRDDLRKKRGEPPQRLQPLPGWAVFVAGAALLLGFAPAVLADPLGLGAAASAGWTLLAVGGVSLLLGVALFAWRAPTFLCLTFALTGLCLAYFGRLALWLR